MSSTPQGNATLQEIAEALLSCDDIVICGHINPDGDCLGSQLTLALALQAAGKRAVCVLAEEKPLNDNYAFLPGADTFIPAAHYKGEVGAFVSVDVSIASRIGDAKDLLSKAAFSATIDHHANGERLSQLAYIDPHAASCTVLVWELIGYLGIDISTDMAQCAYTGLITDTGCFMFQNTNEEAFGAAASMLKAGADPALSAHNVYQNRSLASVQLEALIIDRMRFGAQGQSVLSWLSLEDFKRFGASKADAEALIDTLRSLRGVRVACILREQEDTVRGSLRAKDDTDVSRLAQVWGGGGHKAAAGFTLTMPLAEAVEMLAGEMERLCIQTESGKDAS